MDEASISQYITDTFDAVHPVTEWGDTFFFYKPHEPPHDIYFATLKGRDDDYDRASNLNRPSVFRLNIAISKPTFRTLFGSEAPRPGPGRVDTGYDFTALDQLLPHPVYGRMSWVCVLNPSAATFQEMQPLLAEAYDLAVRRHAKRAARG